MDFTGLIVLAALWFLVNLMTQAKRKPPGQPRQAPQPRSSRPQVLRIPDRSEGLDPTQSEGSRLELVLREFERALEQAGAVERPSERPARLPPPPEEEVEERESLEAEPEVVNLETTLPRELRRRVDQDEGAEQIEARRISAAAARDKASSKADHAVFDQRIRQEPADKTATGYTARQLRDAVVWREILGPPVSLREGER